MDKFDDAQDLTTDRSVATCRACGAQAVLERRDYRIVGRHTIVVGWQDLTHCNACGTVSVVRDHSVGYAREPKADGEQGDLVPA